MTYLFALCKIGKLLNLLVNKTFYVLLCSRRISLVNEMVLTYFMTELKMNHHFTMLRRYMLMEDGEFSQCLADQLFEKVRLVVVVIA